MLSVLLCAHNPNRDHLDRTLAALAAQTLPKAGWDLLLVDNASAEPLAHSVDLAWHPHARHVLEPRPGLVSARLRGIAEARGGVLVFVDDDNVLAPDYLEQAAGIADRRPYLGAWGGQIEAEFEVPPPQLAVEQPWLFAVNRVPRDEWSNHARPGGCLPVGAGLCIRTEIARHYAEVIAEDPRRRALDRTGDDLASAGDTDLALTACDLGFAAGRFAALKLTHLIPARRLETAYLVRLIEGVARSQLLLRHLRGTPIGLSSPSRLDDLVRIYRRWRQSPTQRTFEDAWRRGEAQALALLSAAP